MSNKKNSESRKVNEITNDLKNAVMNENSLSAEILSKLNKISADSLNEKTILNRSVWKPEVLKLQKSEKTARRILRSKQFELSSKVIKFAKLNDSVNLVIASENLEKFYFENLVLRSKFSNIDSEKTKGAIIQTASEISLSLQSK
jgi:hypothetical protein